MTQSYIIYNSAMSLTAAPVKQPTGNAIRTMLQLAPSIAIKPIAWGCSFDGSAAAVPGIVELIETGTIFATMSTASLAADIQPYSDPNARVNTAGASGELLALGSTALTGFATAAVTEGTTVASRMADLQLVAPTNQYTYNWPLGREFVAAGGRALRIRTTFPVSVGMLCFVIFEPA